jgi:uncharacterized paraquat-inducible protein A
MSSRLPACPDCGSTLPYVRINLVQPFECPSCGKTLVVPREYNNKLRRICLVLSIALTVLLAWILKNVFPTILFFPVVGFLVSFFAAIFFKRVFPPEIGDYAVDSAKARYQPL